MTIVSIQIMKSFRNYFFFASIALDFIQNSFLNAHCHPEVSDTTRTGMKFVLRFPRALNTGWLPTNPTDVNQRFNCKSDLGTIGLQDLLDFPGSHFQLSHGQSYSFAISPYVVKSDERIRSISPKL